MTKRKIVAIIGDGVIDKNGEKYVTAFEIGKLLIDNGYRVQTGGLGGVMHAALEGAHASKLYKEGDTMGILPTLDINDANAFVDIAIPTGLDLMRNMLVANAQAVIAVGGGAGTLSEMAQAWTMGKLIISLTNVEGWSKKLADTRIDSRKRSCNYADDRVFGAATPSEALELLNKYIAIYSVTYNGIKSIDKSELNCKD